MLVSFGGCAQDRERCFNDVGLLDTRPRPRRWRKPIVYGRAPAARGGHTATLVGEHMYVFGGAGAGGRPMNDVAVLDLQPRLLSGASGVAPRMAWGRPALTGALPARREGHSATLLGGSRIFVFGGFSEGRLLNDVAVLATGLLAWQRPDVSGEPPSPREGHVAAAAGDLGLIAVFGGFGGAGAERGALADLVVLDTRTMAWTRPQHSGPAPSARERAASLVLGATLLISGGCDPGRGRCFDDARSLDLETLRWEETSVSEAARAAMAPRGGHTLTQVGAHLYAMGGCFLGRRCFGGGGGELLELVAPGETGDEPDGPEPGPEAVAPGGPAPGGPAVGGPAVGGPAAGGPAAGHTERRGTERLGGSVADVALRWWGRGAEARKPGGGGGLQPSAGAGNSHIPQIPTFPASAASERGTRRGSGLGARVRFQSARSGTKTRAAGADDPPWRARLRQALEAGVSPANAVEHPASAGEAAAASESPSLSHGGPSRTTGPGSGAKGAVGGVPSSVARPEAEEEAARAAARRRDAEERAKEEAREVEDARRERVLLAQRAAEYARRPDAKGVVAAAPAALATDGGTPSTGGAAPTGAGAAPATAARRVRAPPVLRRAAAVAACLLVLAAVVQCARRACSASGRCAAACRRCHSRACRGAVHGCRGALGGCRGPCAWASSSRRPRSARDQVGRKGVARLDAPGTPARVGYTKIRRWDLIN
jgi:hypothetical protein